MRKALAAAAACVVLAASAISPASAANRHHNGDREQFMQNYCGNHRDSDCRDWSRNHDRWDDARYNSWYERHHRNHDFDSGNSAAALFGFAAGTAAGIITGTVNGSMNGGHVAACEARYRSYSSRTDSFMGYDGNRHECRL